MESVKEKVSVDCESDDIDENEQCAQSVQCDFDKSTKSSIDKLQHNPKMVTYYTGFENYYHFKFLVLWHMI